MLMKMGNFKVCLILYKAVQYAHYSAELQIFAK